MSPLHAWTLCTLLFFASALSFLDRQVLSVLAPQLIAEFGMSNTEYSRVVFAFVLSYTVMFSVGGKLMDRMGTSWGLGSAVTLWSLASAAHAWAAGPWGLGIARFLLGVGEGACFPAVTKGAVEWMPQARRALAISFANGGSAFGAVVAPPLTAWTTLRFGWKGAFLGTAILGLVWLLGWILATRKLPRAQKSSAATVQSTELTPLWKRKQMRRLMAARFLFDPVFYFYMFWIPQYLARERGYSLQDIGNQTWIPFFVLGVANLLAGGASDRLARGADHPKRVRLGLMLAAALLTPASCLAPFTPSSGMAIALLSLLMFAHGFWITNFITLIGDAIEPSKLGAAVGLTGTCGGIAGMISNLIIGPCVDRFGFVPLFLAMALLYPMAWSILATGGFWSPNPAKRTIEYAN
ncbi:MAG: MFS transporter [Bryobacteraceae bacterium]|nr:MFS transporter [Bryobacteraceae bacterium]MDW8376857.1 MFS transporter [Bryobacterales bacterium]